MRMRVLAALLALGLALPASAEIVAARYADETGRYAHGVLGDAIEYETLVVTLADGSERRARYLETLVFEDVAPRLVDLDGDGAAEVITVESHETRGARLSIWGWRDDALAPLAATPFIGTRFRWLAPVGVGAADLDGDGTMEIAYIDRPHLAKTLRVWRYEAGAEGPRLTELASMGQLTNHRIGEDHISGGIRTCGQRPELVLADATWESIMAVWLHDGALRKRALAPFVEGAGFDAALRCRGGT
jgi:hypothetical protein